MKYKLESEEGMERLTEKQYRALWIDLVEKSNAQQQEINKLKRQLSCERQTVSMLKSFGLHYGEFPRLEADKLIDKLVKDKDEQAKRIMELEKALKKIANSIPYMRKEAESSGCALDGMMAIRLSEDPHYYREIAQNAIDALLGDKEDEN